MRLLEKLIIHLQVATVVARKEMAPLGVALLGGVALLKKVYPRW